MQTRVIIAAVREAIGIPYGASEGDMEPYRQLLAERVMRLNVTLQSIGENTPGTGPSWNLEYLRSQLAELPVTYRTDYAEVLADLRAASDETTRRRAR